MERPTVAEFWRLLKENQLKNFLLGLALTLSLFSNVHASSVSLKDLTGTWIGSYTDDSSQIVGSATVIFNTPGNSAKKSFLTGNISLANTSCGILDATFRGVLFGDIVRAPVQFPQTTYILEVEINEGGTILSGHYYRAGGCGINRGIISLTKQ